MGCQGKPYISEKPFEEEKLLNWKMGFVFVFAITSCLCLAALWSADLLALLYVTFCSAFATFPYGVLGRLWYLIVSIPGLCLPLYFVESGDES